MNNQNPAKRDLIRLDVIKEALSREGNENGIDTDRFSVLLMLHAEESTGAKIPLDRMVDPDLYVEISKTIDAEVRRRKQTTSNEE